jgi:hypothetical protein
MLTRRKLLRSALAISGTTALERAFGSRQPSIDVRIVPGTRLAAIPQNFVGLGYEMSSVARPGLLSSRNASNVRLVRNLGREGVVRVGGIVADFTSYSDTATAAAEPKETVITRACLQQLRGFLDMVGWTAIWSVNFGRGTLEQALVEVRAVREALGDRLLAIELGNEVENYGRGAEALRKPPYTFAEFRAEYDRWRSAILAANPGLSFAAPDTAESVEWVEQMAADAHGDVQLLTTHYYRGGQKQATLDQLMSPDPSLTAKLERLHRASMLSGIPWRMCETNSFFGGGRPGLSDTFAAALWTLDYMLLLAQSGCAGVNIETGFNQLGFLSSYSPIRNDNAGQCTAGASYYGMLAFAFAIARGTNSGVFPLHSGPAPKEASFYALGQAGRIQCVVLINRTLDQPMRISLSDVPLHNAGSIRLAAPSPESKVDMTLGGAGVDATGKWSPREAEPVTREVLLAPCSAVIAHSRS